MHLELVWVSFTDLDLHVAFVTVDNQGHRYVSLHSAKMMNHQLQKSNHNKMRVVIDQTHLRKVRSLMPVHPE